MADGTTAFSGGLGLKGVDSQDVRMQRGFAGSSTTKPLLPLGASQLRTNPPNSALISGLDGSASSPGLPNAINGKYVPPNSRFRSQSIDIAPINLVESLDSTKTPIALNSPELIQNQEDIPPGSGLLFGPHSPKHGGNPSPSRQLQQVLQQEVALIQPDAAQSSGTQNPPILVNGKGASYVESDPSLGYQTAARQPRPANPHRPFPAHPRAKPQNTNNPKVAPKDWSYLFKSQGPSQNMKLEDYPEFRKGGKHAVVQLEVSHLDEKVWTHCLVGHFLEGRMDFALANSTAHKLWGRKTKYGLHSVKAHAGFLYFEFKDEESKLAVLESGPWFFSQKYIVLTAWKRFMTPTRTPPTTVPAWVKLHKLPQESWTKEGLSRIASAVGKPNLKKLFMFGPFGLH